MLLSGVGHLNLGRNDGEDGDGMALHQALSPSDLTKTGEGGLLMLPLKNRRVSVCLQLRHSTAHRNLLSGQELTGR